MAKRLELVWGNAPIKLLRIVRKIFCAPNPLVSMSTTHHEIEVAHLKVH